MALSAADCCLSILAICCAVIVEHLEQECCSISSMLKDVMAVDAAAAAEAEAEAAGKKRWRPSLVSKTSAVRVGLAATMSDSCI